jgi:hypothetical protein
MKRSESRAIAKSKATVLSELKPDVLTSPAEAFSAASAGACLTGLKAVLAIHGTIPSRLEWNSGLLSAPRTGHACTL